MWAGAGRTSAPCSALTREFPLSKWRTSIAIPAVVAVAAALASPGHALAQDGGAGLVLSQCAAELGLTEAECACVIETARVDLSERQVDYLMVRIARNDAEIMRMREFMGPFERLAILWAVQRAVAICAPGKDVRMPES